MCSLVRWGTHFQFQNEEIFHEEIREVLPDTLALVAHGERRLMDCPHAADTQFLHQRTFVDLFQKAGTQSIRDLKNSCQYAFREVIAVLHFVLFTFVPQM